MVLWLRFTSIIVKVFDSLIGLAVKSSDSAEMPAQPIWSLSLAAGPYVKDGILEVAIIVGDQVGPSKVRG